MKNFISALLFAIVSLATPVQAQVAADWLGGYYGFSLGDVDGSPAHYRVRNRSSHEVDVQGFAFGASYGRNYAADRMVYGFEVDINVSNADGLTRVRTAPRAPCDQGGQGCKNELNAFASLRGRLGTVTPSGLLI